MERCGANHQAPYIKVELKFVYKGPKTRMQETSRKFSHSSIILKRSSLTPDPNAEIAQRDFDTPPSSTCSGEPSNIDPRLLAETTLPFVEPSICATTEVVDLSTLDPEATSSPSQVGLPNDSSIVEPDTREQDLEHPDETPMQPLCAESADAELDDDQFIVERLLRKRVRRFRRRKVVQYLARWKGIHRRGKHLEGRSEYTWRSHPAPLPGV